MNRVECPFCHRLIPLDSLGAKDLHGLGVVMQFHFGGEGNPLVHNWCKGSNRSVEELKKAAQKQ